MIGIIPAAGAGLRIQPLGCSKELLPVGSREVDGVERPKAVSEYLVERMIAAGARQICMVISAEKSDIVRYYAERDYAAEIFYAVQRKPRGLCDALFRAESLCAGRRAGADRTAGHDLVSGERLSRWRLDRVSGEQGPEVNLVLFPVENPSAFDAVLRDESGRVERVVVKQPNPGSNWIWGAVTASGRAFHDLHLLWESRHRADEYLGDLLNAYIAAGNPVQRHGQRRTLHGRGHDGGLSQRAGLSAGARRRAAKVSAA